MANLIREHFSSISEMLSVMSSRTNNSVMHNKNSSHDGSEDFTGTRSWGEAMNLYRFGYVDILPEIKKGTAQVGKSYAALPRNKIVTDVVGYVPHVPNSILNLPNSMIATKKVPQKVKAISITYAITANCNEDAKNFIKAGVAILSAINMLELSGIRVNLNVCFYYASASHGNKSEQAFGTIKLKDYREHLDIQKLCFPLAHPSFFRRFGFRWLETCEGLTHKDWAFGYGTQLEKMTPEIQACLKKDETFITLQDVKAVKYDARKIVEQIKK